MKRIPRVLWLSLLLSPLAIGATATAPTDQKDLLDEVVVEGSGSALDRIRQQMIRVEDTFFKRYNQLNIDHDFDVYCDFETRAGTNTRHRHCRTGYQEKELQREGHDYLEAMKNMDDGSGNPEPWVPPSPLIMKRQFKDYQQNMRDVVTRNPDLVDMLRERYELGLRYEATRRKMFHLKSSQGSASAEPTAAIPP